MAHETDLHARIAELRRQHDATAGAIKTALISGADTAGLRAAHAETARAICSLEQRLADDASQRQAASQEAISAVAGVIAADAANAVTNLLVRLAAPEHP
jgi:uncharacterized protein YfaS (alpha-2-macroglobulin family)